MTEEEKPTIWGVTANWKEMTPLDWLKTFTFEIVSFILIVFCYFYSAHLMKFFAV